MTALKVLVLAVVQGLAELLPVSSSAHVVVAEKLMGLDPSAPDMTMLLVMLHTGTMFAVVFYFWTRWKERFFSSASQSRWVIESLLIATVMTGVIGEAIIFAIERTLARHIPGADVEQLFGRLDLIAPALAVAGALIVVAAWADRSGFGANQPLRPTQAVVIGAVQALCLPFRGFSRSGATISTAMLAGVGKAEAEEFSFALAVLLTPPVIAREGLRLFRLHQGGMGSVVALSVFGGCCAFVAGVVALKWLTQWLGEGRWHVFGIYCLCAAVAVASLYHVGY